ncbi:hypothetical protein BDA99DRAFT_540680 [Phascolomyces articulosus]|uniref:Uncharacterized protein n=1 Tax=Phascolomyces articulosus TaxID=60185 RepID=A0AAD5PAV9_9FUNG|nr:hypothetical protein BDA99DRAFT_540680 [Phascolomyces articulosus]
MRCSTLAIFSFLVLFVTTSFSQQNGETTDTTAAQQLGGNGNTQSNQEQTDTTIATPASDDTSLNNNNNIQGFDIRRGDINDLEHSFPASFPNWLRGFQNMHSVVEERATQPMVDEQQTKQQTPALPAALPAPAPAADPPSSPTRQEAPIQPPPIREQQQPVEGQVVTDPSTEPQQQQPEQQKSEEAQEAVPSTNDVQVVNDPNVNNRQVEVTSTYTLPGKTSTPPIQTTTTPIPTTPPHTTMMTSALVSTVTHTITETPLPRPSTANTLFASNNFIDITVMLLVVFLIH